LRSRGVRGGLRNEVGVNGRHTITTDEPQSLGGTDTAPAPHELLPAMVASCISTMIVLYAQRRGWRLDAVRVDVTYDSDVTPRHVTVSVHLPDGLASDQVERLRRVAQSCPARKALEAGFSLEERPHTRSPVWPRWDRSGPGAPEAGHRSGAD
jgi:putative redox protein